MPATEFTAGKPPVWLLPGLLKPALSVKGLLIGGPKTDGLLVLHKGRLVYEQYWNGYDKDKAHAIHSVTKSVVSALVGIAIAEGKIGGVGDNVISYFPEAEALLPAGQESKKDMTIEHLLTMTSGLPGDFQGNSWALDPSIDAEALANSDQPLMRFLVNQCNPPGKRFAYSTDGVHVLGGVVSRAVGKSLLDYANETLFGPLGISVAGWEQYPDGSCGGGSGLSMTPRDMLKFGYLYLNQGRWEDQQLVPADWVAQSPPRSKAPKAYGRLFWNYSLAPFRGAYEANGIWGQYIIIQPSRDLVIVRTGQTGSVISKFVKIRA